MLNKSEISKINEEINELTSQLKAMSGGEAGYAAIWDERAALIHKRYKLNSDYNAK